jgi:hypothetical protein
MRSVGDTLYNFHWVLPGEIARSAQAYAGFLGPFLTRHGMRAVLNLRGPNPKFRWWHYEKRVCDRLGVTHFDMPLNSRNLVLRLQLTSMLDFMQTAPKPLLVKCSGGQDRTSFACALFLLNKNGWSYFDEAMMQFSRWPYLHFPKTHQRWLKQFFLYARGHAGEKSLREWIAEDYTPEDFKAWLDANGMKDFYRTLYKAPPRGLLEANPS